MLVCYRIVSCIDRLGGVWKFVNALKGPTVVMVGNGKVSACYSGVRQREGVIEMRYMCIDPFEQRRSHHRFARAAGQYLGGQQSGCWYLGGVQYDGVTGVCITFWERRSCKLSGDRSLCRARGVMFYSV